MTWKAEAEADTESVNANAADIGSGIDEFEAGISTEGPVRVREERGGACSSEERGQGEFAPDPELGSDSRTGIVPESRPEGEER